MRKCHQCQGTNIKVSKKDYDYKESGLDDIILPKISLYACMDCGSRQVCIPKVEDVHRRIFCALLAKPKLNKKERQFVLKALMLTEDYTDEDRKSFYDDTDG